ncbi:hypothetical protein Tco_0766545 [Tanacetum coccineum]
MRCGVEGGDEVVWQRGDGDVREAAAGVGWWGNEGGVTMRVEVGCGDDEMAGIWPEAAPVAGKEGRGDGG